VDHSRIALREDSDSGTEVYYILTDHLGSTSKVVQVDGSSVTVTAQQWYSPWGEPRQLTGEMPTDRTFQGQREHSALGMLWYSSRYYDPHLGRFTQPDSIVPNAFFSLAFDRYQYVFSNPLRYVDPSGHNPECGPDGAFCDEDDWNDYDYDPIELTSNGRKIVKIARELERLLGIRVTLRIITGLIFERELDGMGGTVVSILMAGAAGMEYFRWALEEYSTQTKATFLNWLGRHNQVVNSLHTDIFTNLPQGKKPLDAIIGSTRDYAKNASEAKKIAATLFAIPEKLKVFDVNAPYSWGNCIAGGDCMINPSRLDEFNQVLDTTQNPDGSYNFSIQKDSFYFKSGNFYVVTSNQNKYWKSKP
jgi:RHS repeat-associated protein